MWLAYKICGNYGFSIVIFTLVMQLIQIPIVIKQKKSMAQSTALQPEQEKIRKMYKDNPQKQQEEVQKLQSESGYSMASGCLPLLIQLPILYGLLDVIYRPLHYILRIPATVIDSGIEIANSIGFSITSNNRMREMTLLGAIQSDPSAFAALGAGTIATITSLNPNVFGVSLVGTPQMGTVTMIFPIAAALLSLLQTLYSQYLTKKAAQANNITANKMSIIMILMNPIILLWMGFNFPIGLNFYWSIRSVIYLLQEWILDMVMPQSKLVADAMAKMKDNRKKAQNENKKKAVVNEKGETVYESKAPSNKRLSAARKEDAEKYLQEYSDEELQANIDKLNEARRRDAEKYDEVFVEATAADFQVLLEEEEPKKKKKK